MNPTSQAEAKKLTKEVVSGLGRLKKRTGTEVVLCPPFSYLQIVGTALKSGVKLGAQNTYIKDSGAYTGEVSSKMLQDLKCEYVIVGHSERRNYFNEDSELINGKLKSVLKHKITPVLAVGEKEGESISVIKKQVIDAFEGITPGQVKKMVIAYEPIWAIGTGKVASTDDAMSARIFIQKTLSDLYSKNTAESVPVIYGGSTNSKNISSFIIDAGMMGALVGGSSLNPKEFIKMIEQII